MQVLLARQYKIRVALSLVVDVVVMELGSLGKEGPTQAVYGSWRAIVEQRLPMLVAVALQAV